MSVSAFNPRDGEDAVWWRGDAPAADAPPLPPPVARHTADALAAAAAMKGGSTRWRTHRRATRFRPTRMQGAPASASVTRCTTR